MPDLYRHLAPSLQVPQQLVAAQQRKTTQISQTSQSAEKYQSGSQKLSGQITILSSSADWFRQTYCSNSSLINFCRTDVRWASVIANSVNYFEVTGMAADSVSTARFMGKYWSCSGLFNLGCSWRTAWDITIQPHWAHRYYFSGFGSYYAGIWGNNPNPLVHFAAMWR